MAKKKNHFLCFSSSFLCCLLIIHEPVYHAEWYMYMYILSEIKTPWYTAWTYIHSYLPGLDRVCVHGEWRQPHGEDSNQGQGGDLRHCLLTRRRVFGCHCWTEHPGVWGWQLPGMATEPWGCMMHSEGYHKFDCDTDAGVYAFMIMNEWYLYSSR